MNLIDSIDAVSKSLTEITQLDNQVFSDHLRYSEWILGVSTAGFALVVGRFDKITETSWIANNSTELSLLSASCVCLIISAVSGAFVKLTIGRAMEFGRKRLSMVLQQNLDIRLGLNDNIDSNVEDKKVTVRQIAHGHFLPSKEKRLVEVATNYIDECSLKYKKILSLQQATAAVAYLIIFTVFVPAG